MRSARQTGTWSATDTDVPALRDALRQLRSPDCRRIATCTIVAPVDDLGDATEVRSALRDLSRRHPSRALVVVRVPDEVSGLDAEVAWMACERRGISVVFFEDVFLRVRGDALRGLPAVVRALAHQGLPVILWTYDGLPAPDEPLLDLADRVLVDSTRTGTVAESSHLLGLSRRTTTTDLAWVALEPWREAAGAVLAGIGHPPSGRTVERIEIHGQPGPPDTLAAWLMSRFALDADIVRLVGAERLAMRIWTRCDDRDTLTSISDQAMRPDAALHHGTVVVDRRSPLEMLDQALGCSGGDAEWEPTLVQVLEQRKDTAR